MDRLADLKDDMKRLGDRLDGAIAALGDPDSKLNGSDAAALARERRSLGELITKADPSFDRVAQVRIDYDRLEDALGMSSGGAAAVVVRERRMLSEVLEQLEAPEVVPFVDQLASRRKARAGDSGPAARRRQPRRGA